jgi:acetoin:2,6-dichlorophenolindophenol oxidoreductase subunit alpha
MSVAPSQTAGPESANAGSLPHRLLTTMALIRAFDTMLPVLYNRGLLAGSSHAAIGQEAVAAGACAALDRHDLMVSTHRGHGHALAKGADPVRMMAELIGRSTGYCRGKGGSMHIADFSHGSLGANGIVGAGIGLATGAGLASQLDGSGRVTLCFFGEGAFNQGTFLESLNMAAIWKLPVVYVCENNHFAMSATPDKMVAVTDLVDRARGCGVDGVNVDGMDALAVHAVVSEAVGHARAGAGPRFIAAECYRFEGHFAGDTMSYRDNAESSLWRERDPIETLRVHLATTQGLSHQQFEKMTAAAEQTVADALAAASEAPHPRPEEAFEDLYV